MAVVEIVGGSVSQEMLKDLFGLLGFENEVDVISSGHSDHNVSV